MIDIKTGEEVGSEYFRILHLVKLYNIENY